MANPATLATIRTRCRQRADKVNSTFVTDAELNELINQALSELHGILVTHFQDYVLTTSSLTITAGVEYTALPTTFFKSLAIFKLEGTQRYRLERFNIDDLAPFSEALWLSSNTGSISSYRIAGDRVYWYPKPVATTTAEIWFVPQIVRLSADGDVVGVQLVDGWEEFVVNDVALKIRLKEDGDAQPHMIMKQEFIKRLEIEAANRDAGRPFTVVDTNKDWGL
jgi:hypothetical protein